MNEHDSERIYQLLATVGYQPAAGVEDADLVVLNTCSVREKPQHKVYSELGSFHKQALSSSRDVLFAVGGCVAQQEGIRLLETMPWLDLVFGTHALPRLPELVRGIELRGGPVVATELQDPESFVFVEDDLGFKHNLITSQVVIANGCDNFCTYCIVPYVRGREVSRPAAQILDEVRRLVEAGVAEVLLLGQNVNSYRSGELDFPGLLRQVSAIEGLRRIRFTSSHPKDVSAGLVEQLCGDPKLCKHMHLPVQAGSNKLLAAMGRGYDRETYVELVTRLRAAVPALAFSTDVIVGFPGERDEDFAETLALVSAVRYDKVHSFMYSPRPLTAAAGLGDQVDPEVKRERLHRLQEVQDAVTAELYAENVGCREVVLVEGRSRNGGTLTGRTDRNRIVHLAGTEDLCGRMVQVRIVEACRHSLLGEVIAGEVGA